MRVVTDLVIPMLGIVAPVNVGGIPVQFFFCCEVQTVSVMRSQVPPISLQKPRPKSPNHPTWPAPHPPPPRARHSTPHHPSRSRRSPHVSGEHEQLAEAKYAAVPPFGALGALPAVSFLFSARPRAVPVGRCAVVRPFSAYASFARPPRAARVRTHAPCRGQASRCGVF